MLKPNQFTAGALADAKGLTFLLPRTKYEEPTLIVPGEDGLFAIFLGEKHRFNSFECSSNRRWKGLLVGPVAVEVDEGSLFDPDAENAPAGALLRQDTGLYVSALNSAERFTSLRARLFPVAADLAPCGDGARAGFRKWQITIGEGIEKRVLQAVSVEPAASPM
jgi:hypothetical protein